MRAIPALLFVLALSGCSYRLWVKVDGEQARPRFSVKAPRIMDPSVCFRRIVVTEAARPDRRLWEIDAVGDACAPDSEIFYGTVPAGFQERSPAAALQAGVLYEALASSGAADGDIHFVFLDGQWRTVSP
ncbi:hypothetical protein MMB232_02873 [Brevundimonas subvibrioides]|uniref:hypothetical protein n=1 Tax=Brevundimonas subvibrioides TaxID=74313 RepID=UPI0032D5782C